MLRPEEKVLHGTEWNGMWYGLDEINDTYL